MFRKAERKKAKLRLGMCGASGNGKTWSSLEIAFGMTTGDKIFFIDTESGRGELYQGLKSKHDSSIVFDYNYYRLDVPYSVERYIEAIKNAEQNGCEVLIIDSLSHAWSGEGGVLSVVDKAGGQFQGGWKQGTPKQNALIDTIIASKMHIICNFRVKTEYVMELNEKGKHAPRKIGLAPIQRDQVEYEFTMFMSMSPEHIAHVTKDNTQIYDQQFVQPSPDMGRKLLTWLNMGNDFKGVILSDILDEIHTIENMKEMNDYKSKYINYYKQYATDYPEEFAKITEAKDKRKEELMEIDMEEMTPPPMVISSKHSQALIQGTL